MRITAILLAKIGKLSTRYSNLPERYIDRVVKHKWGDEPIGKPQFMSRPHKPKKLYFSIHRPWTKAFAYDMQRKKSPVIVEPIKDWSFFRGDLVEVLHGKDKGKQGLVKDIIQERNWIIVEGLNTKLLNTQSKDTKEKTYYQMEQPLLVTSQVMLVDPSDTLPTAINWRYTETGEYVRVSVRTGKIIPIPASHNETVDYIEPKLYKEMAKDTMPKVVEEVTFEPTLKTFEMDIMDKMGIKEDRIPKKYYWY